MHQRHIGFPAYANTLPVVFLHWHQHMDADGDHEADLYFTGIGGLQRQKSVHNAFIARVMRADGRDCRIEVPCQKLKTKLSPANILVVPIASTILLQPRPIVKYFELATLMKAPQI